jgi:hypothetical protein
MYDARKNTLEAVELIRVIKGEKPELVDKLCVKKYGNTHYIYNTDEDKYNG